MPKIVKKKRKLGSLARVGGPSGVEQSTLRPQLVEKQPPCGHTCPNRNPIRKALMTVSKAEDYGKTYDQALEEAFYIWMEKNPFPAVCGRVCPHPCETECNRGTMEGSVGINAFERFIGDYGLLHKLSPKKLTDEVRTDKVAIVGSGPAGMTCAYHLSRLGYPVTVFEAFPEPGGMLHYGIPDYRLPVDVLDAEINRIVDMGIELKLNTSVGHDVPMDNLRKEYKAIFVGLGAHRGLQLRVEGEEADNVFTGTDFLHRVNEGEKFDVGSKVVVIGGGDTAIDAARVSKRLGADVIILYRRTRNEMPTIEAEIEGALEEGIDIQYLAAPIEINNENGKAVGMHCQRMELGEPDASGRRRPVPIEGDTFDLDCTCIIAAISQEPDFTGFDNLVQGKDWIKIDEKGKTNVDNVFSGGDNINLDIAITAIYHGRRAAEAIHEMISGQPMVQPPELPVIKTDKMYMAYYQPAPKSPIEELPVAERLKSLDLEIVKTWSQETAIQEAKRCLSCGMCFDCGTCWSLCTDNAIIKPLKKGDPYRVKMEFCTGCKKCAENCPCGYIEMH